MIWLWQCRVLVALCFYCLTPTELDDLDWDRCQLVGAAMVNEGANKVFFICSSDLDTVIVYDAIQFTETCRDFYICDKTIRFTNIKPIGILQPQFFEVYRADFCKDKCTIYIWRPWSGAYASLTFKRKKDEIRLLKWTLGAF